MQPVRSAASCARCWQQRRFPLDDVRFFASARSAGTTLPWAGGEVVVEDGSAADLSGIDIAVFSNGKTASLELAPQGRRGRGDRRRQLLGLAQGPRRAAGRQRGQPRGPRTPPRASSPTRTARRWRHAGARSRCTARPDLRAAARRVLPGRVRLGRAPASPSSTSRCGRWRTTRPAWRSTVGRSACPAPTTYVAPDRVQRRAAGRLDRRRRQRRDRRGAEAAQRVPQDPARPRPAGRRHLRPGAGVHRSLLAVHAEFARPHDPDEATELLQDAAGRRARPTSPRRWRPPAATPCYVGRIRTDPTAPDGRGLSLFVVGDNLRKGAALNAVQIAEELLARRF